MSSQRMTVQVAAVQFGDEWLGSTVTGIANSWRPENMDITLYDPAAQQSRTVTINKTQWFAVTRDV
jgi:hypothetical protein